MVVWFFFVFFVFIFVCFFCVFFVARQPKKDDQRRGKPRASRLSCYSKDSGTHVEIPSILTDDQKTRIGIYALNQLKKRIHTCGRAPPCFFI
jgi:hypothetical protein